MLGRHWSSIRRGTVKVQWHTALMRLLAVCVGRVAVDGMKGERAHVQ